MQKVVSTPSSWRPCHHAQVDLRELEPRLQRMGCKLVDFGNAAWGSAHCADEVQTRQYRAPEVSGGRGSGLVVVGGTGLACTLLNSVPMVDCCRQLLGTLQPIRCSDLTTTHSCTALPCCR